MINSFNDLDSLYKLLNAYVREYEEAFGKPNKTIDTIDEYIDRFELLNQCRVYVRVNRIIVITPDDLYMIPFGKITGYDVINGKKRLNSSISSSSTTTKIDTGDMLKRALVGGLIAGDVGSIIGAATAKRNTYKSEVDEFVEIMDPFLSTYPIYELLINISDSQFPIVSVPFGSHKEDMHKFISVLDWMININRSLMKVEKSIIIHRRL